MDHEDIMEAVAALNDAVAKADALADKCRGMIMNLYAVPLGDDEEHEVGQHWRAKYPWYKTDEVGGEFFYPCEDDKKGKARPSITASGKYRYGSGKISVRSVKGGFQVIRKA